VKNQCGSCGNVMVNYWKGFTINLVPVGNSCTKFGDFFRQNRIIVTKDFKCFFFFFFFFFHILTKFHPLRKKLCSLGLGEGRVNRLASDHLRIQRRSNPYTFFLCF